jgi:hypothetical protein
VSVTELSRYDKWADRHPYLNAALVVTGAALFTFFSCWIGLYVHP